MTLNTTIATNTKATGITKAIRDNSGSRLSPLELDEL